MLDPTKKEELTARRLESWNNERDVQELITVIRKGKILEMGCGTGRIIEDLSKLLTESVFVGVDISDYMLRIAKKKDIVNAIFIKASATHRIFLSNSFDYVVFRDSLHEIYRSFGEKGIKSALRNAYHVLKREGRVIVRDSMEPKKELVRITFGNPFFKKEFWDFSRRFEGGIEFREGPDYAVLDIKGVVAFLSRLVMKGLRVIDESDRLCLLSSFTLERFDELLGKSGFKKLEIRRYPFPQELIPQGISFKPTELPSSYCMLVYEK